MTDDNVTIDELFLKDSCVVNKLRLNKNNDNLIKKYVEYIESECKKSKLINLHQKNA